MFHNLNWEMRTVYKDLNIKYDSEPAVPNKILYHQGLGISIVVAPYRVIYEPCIANDDNCQIDVNFHKGIPCSLIKLLSSHKEKMNVTWLAHSDKKISGVFGLKEKALNSFLLIIEIFLSAKEANSALSEGFKVLRAFLRLPNQDQELKQLLLACYDVEEFKRCIPNPDNLIQRAETFPDYAYMLIQPLMNNPSEFKHWFWQKRHLSAIKPYFPECEDALTGVQMHMSPSKMGMFSQLDASPSGGNPQTPLQQSLLSRFEGFK